ncbi:MAG: pyridoxal phosphate-dependent aminotransferase [Chlamydiales bacterium]|nr:pyridoxal phosphate-dependent aminotransferase [Chlamydiales bacterium]
MKYPVFKLENYLAKREFIAPFNLCASDVETHSMREIIEMADQESFNLWNGLNLGYTETQGNPLLREEIRKLYGEEINQKEILCFAGAEEGVYCSFQALLESNDHAVVVTPCYQSLESLPSSICSTTKVPLQYQKRWELDIEEIANAIQPNTKVLVVNFPHNPTGALITKDTQLALVELARKHGLWIFSDEVYRLLEVNPADRILPFASIYEKGISLSVMSKAYGLAGLRIGWIACRESSLLEKMNEIKHYLSICNSGPSEVLALMALRASEKIYECNRSLLQDNLKQFDHFFEKYQNWFEWIRPKGGCIGYPLFKGALPIEKIADDLLEQSGVLILPGNIYDDKSNHFRVSFGRKSLPQALERFTQFIEKNQIKWRKGGVFTH